MKCDNCGKSVGDIPYGSMWAKCPYCTMPVNEI